MWFYEKQRDPTITGSHAADVSLTGVACFALGAAAMYFFDPKNGRDRRKALADQVKQLSSTTGEALSGASTYVREHAGQAGEYVREHAGSIAGSAKPKRGRSAKSSSVDDQQIRHRVRAELGNLTSNVSDVHVEVEAGVVTLTGNLPAGEIDGLMNVVNNISGVRQLNNHLSANEYGADPSSRSTL